MQVIERVLYTPAQIQKRIAELGAQITKDYAGDSLLVIGVLRGVLFFMADLLVYIVMFIKNDLN